MEPRKIWIRFFVLLVVSSVTTFFTLTDARHAVQFSNIQGMKKAKLSSHTKIHLSSGEGEESNGLSTPFPMPPFESIAPISSPHSKIPAPFCIYPPSTSTPNLPFRSPPHADASPPALSPALSPPSTGIHTPPVYQPPMVQPPHKKPQFAIWCVAKPTVPDSIIQEAIDYACGSGADCKPIQLNGQCFQPNTLFAHASYAFNSYWQNTKISGGTCDFGGIAMLVTTDPSFDDCDFIYN